MSRTSFRPLGVKVRQIVIPLFALLNDFPDKLDSLSLLGVFFIQYHKVTIHSFDIAAMLVSIGFCGKLKRKFK